MGYLGLFVGKLRFYLFWAWVEALVHNPKIWAGSGQVSAQYQDWSDPDVC